ncbi:MAG: hypothetical protein K2N95_04215 [Lachnospiraceae bacterium]|nr:hypothetical protein [Lachnospiraceae bacterium]
MEYIYNKFIEKIEETGMLSLIHRKEIWKRFGKSSDDFTSGKEKRFQLALACVRKVNDALLESIPLYEIKETVNELLDLLEDETGERDYDEAYDEVFTFCEELVQTTDSFVAGYFQQAIEHLIEIKERDEPLIAQRYESVTKDETLEVDETDTSYGTSIVWKYQDECASKLERKRKERQFWIWYVRKAAEIEGIAVNVTAEESCEGESCEQNMQEIEINSLEDFVGQVSCDYKFISAGKKKHIVTLKVYNLNHDDRCPICGQTAANPKEFWGSMDLGMIEDWKIELSVREHLYYCENPLCQKNQFFPRDTDSFIERVANFTHIRNIHGMKEKLCEMFESI